MVVPEAQQRNQDQTRTVVDSEDPFCYHNPGDHVIPGGTSCVCAGGTGAVSGRRCELPDRMRAEAGERPGHQDPLTHLSVQEVNVTSSSSIRAHVSSSLI